MLHYQININNIYNIAFIYSYTHTRINIVNMSFEPIRIGNTVIRRSKSNASMYEITNEASPHLMKSIGDKASFEATDVMTMRNYLKRNRHATEMYVALRLVHDLGRQMQALIETGRSIACIGVDDVIVVTHRTSDKFTHDSINDLDSTLGDACMDPQFMFLNDHLIFEVDDDGTLYIDHALPNGKSKSKSKSNSKSKSKYAFMSPELRHVLESKSQPQSAEPLQVHFKTIYYSAAQLIIYFLLNVDRIPDDTADTEFMNPIKNTKLYWFLLRCLTPVPTERKYIYI